MMLTMFGRCEHREEVLTPIVVPYVVLMVNLNSHGYLPVEYPMFVGLDTGTYTNFPPEANIAFGAGVPLRVARRRRFARPQGADALYHPADQEL